MAPSTGKKPKHSSGLSRPPFSAEAYLRSTSRNTPATSTTSSLNSKQSCPLSAVSCRSSVMVMSLNIPAVTVTLLATQPPEEPRPATIFKEMLSMFMSATSLLTNRKPSKPTSTPISQKYFITMLEVVSTCIWQAIKEASMTVPTTPKQPPQPTRLTA